ncbi:MAG: cation diffusion facilitator family transporter [Desulfarculaceae bacterium]|nr:cation diffusion facilitator family transporter [Desulfarculaceae bacterium]MCF8046250.1 cation diffusion facilitator family transporter [Desulfarculaceae bacterium]MCF8063651.1 cation diffusion facilitator family transporter [Desulfarculaceae bacterium]MCF8097099.1 cation diffusion facilitator family transporter [Desulfarculaceae bacterium]MCF8120967.1 cation diffusion facilitator family transporter [Desulfarculaceae bacterium]
MSVDLKQQGRQGRRVTWVGSWVNLALALGKLLAGIYGNSQAMIADAAHSLSDLVTDAVVLLGLKWGRSDPDDRHPYGHGRIETFSTLVVGAVLFALAIGLGYDAIAQLIRGDEHHPNWLALAAAAVSILAKEALYRYTVSVGRRINSQAVVANAWHHRSDALSSVAVLVGVAGAMINPAWHSLDAWAALVVSLLILKVGAEVLWGALQEMVDTAPSPEVMDSIRHCALSVSGVEQVHDLKVRSLGGRYQMQLHVVVDGGLNVIQGHDIAKAVEHCLQTELPDMGEVIVHVDPAGKD